AKEPALRPQSARAVAEWIGLAVVSKPSVESLAESVFGGPRSGAEDQPRSWNTRIVVLVAGGIITLLLAATIGAWFYTRHPGHGGEGLLASSKAEPDTAAPFNAAHKQGNHASAKALPIRDGLVLYYSFDQPPKNGIVQDESGDGNDGHVVGPQWTGAGQSGGALIFAPANNYIEVPNNPSLNPERLTLSAWIKTSRSDHFFRRLFEKSYRHGFALSIGGDYELWKPPTRNRGRLTFEIGGKGFESNAPVTDGQWHHVAATYDGETARIFVDGLPQTRNPRWNIAIPHNDFALRLGGFVDPDEAHDDPKASFEGTLDEVMIFNRALSAAEVWHLNESFGAPAPSHSTNPTGSQSATDVRQRWGKALNDAIRDFQNSNDEESANFASALLASLDQPNG